MKDFEVCRCQVRVIQWFGFPSPGIIIQTKSKLSDAYALDTFPILDITCYGRGSGELMRCTAPSRLLFCVITSVLRRCSAPLGFDSPNGSTTSAPNVSSFIWDILERHTDAMCYLLGGLNLDYVGLKSEYGIAGSKKLRDPFCILHHLLQRGLFDVFHRPGRDFGCASQ